MRARKEPPGRYAAAHADTIRILHTLTPPGVATAVANESDPYKD